MLKNSSFIVISALAGAIGGAVATLLLFQFGIFPDAPEQKPISDSLSPVVSSYEQSVIQTVEAAQGAVVSIVITKDVPILERYYEDPFNDFFGGSQFQFRVPRVRERGTEKQEVGGGSGFLISADGMIVTNRHVVNQEGAEYTVVTKDGSKYDAKVLARDPVQDIAILEVDGSEFPFLEFANSDELKVGQTAIAIGNVLSEFRNTVSIGVVSGLSRSITAGNGRGKAERLDEVIQTDAAINPGNSGGPLLDIMGRVVGVNVAMARESENIGFALPANIVRSIVDSVRETGSIQYPYLGVRYTMITPVFQEANGLDVDYGALVVRGESEEELAVVPGSPANKAGITEGDIILEAGDQKLDENRSLGSVIQKYKIGDSLQLTVLSKGEEKEVTVTLAEYPY